MGNLYQIMDFSTKSSVILLYSKSFCKFAARKPMDKELYTPEEAYELTMKDIKAIYDAKDDVDEVICPRFFVYNHNYNY